MRRNPEHVMAFLLAELGTEGTHKHYSTLLFD